MKSQLAAGLLAIFFGGIGLHHFYMGRAAVGFLFILFCWTGIPAIIGFFEGVIFLTEDSERWARRFAKE